jgi:hypothetical protein
MPIRRVPPKSPLLDLRNLRYIVDAVPINLVSLLGVAGVAVVDVDLLVALESRQIPSPHFLSTALGARALAAEAGTLIASRATATAAPAMALSPRSSIVIASLLSLLYHTIVINPTALMRRTDAGAGRG